MGASLGIGEAVCRRLEAGSSARKENALDDENPPWGWRGVRRFGNLDTTRFRLMVIGDSFTAGRGIGKAPDYATMLGERLGVEVFSYGGEGYSTAQELMVLRRFTSRVRPDAVLLQMTSNDFVNNSEELEAASFINNNLKVRPYLEQGNMVMRYPRLGGVVRAQTVGSSALARRFFYGLDRARGYLALNGYLRTVEEDIRANPRHRGFQRSVATTRELLSQIKDASGASPLFVFPADGVGPEAVFLEAMRSITAELALPFDDSLPFELTSLDSSDDPVFLPNDPHWSPRGHREAARLLAAWLEGRLKARPR